MPLALHTAPRIPSDETQSVCSAGPRADWVIAREDTESYVGRQIQLQDDGLLRGNRHGGLAEAPYNVYPTADGHIAIICVNETHWKSLLAVMERQDLLTDPRYVNLKGRVEHIDEIDELVGGFTSRFAKQALFDLLMRNHVPCSPVRDLDEVVNDKHMHARRALEWVEHPMYGRVCLPNSPMRYDGVEPIALRPSGTLGCDNQEVYGDWLGLPADELAGLQAEGVI